MAPPEKKSVKEGVHGQPAELQLSVADIEEELELEHAQVDFTWKSFRVLLQNEDGTIPEAAKDSVAKAVAAMKKANNLLGDARKLAATREGWTGKTSLDDWTNKFQPFQTIFGASAEDEARVEPLPAITFKAPSEASSSEGLSEDEKDDEAGQLSPNGRRSSLGSVNSDGSSWSFMNHFPDAPNAEKLGVDSLPEFSDDGSLVSLGSLGQETHKNPV